MNRFAILTLEEGSRLQWRRIERDYYKATGDWGFYLLPPCILLPGLDSIDRPIDIGNGIFAPEQRIAIRGWAAVLPIHDDRLSALSPDAGIFISANRPENEYLFPAETAKVKGISLVESDGFSSRVIRYRPLKRDIEL